MSLTGVNIASAIQAGIANEITAQIKTDQGYQSLFEELGLGEKCDTKSELDDLLALNKEADNFAWAADGTIVRTNNVKAPEGFSTTSINATINGEKYTAYTTYDKTTNNLTEKSIFVGGKEVFKITYEYDKDGNLTSATSTGDEKYGSVGKETYTNYTNNPDGSRSWTMHFDGNPERTENQTIDAQGNFISAYAKQDGTLVTTTAKYNNGNLSEKTVTETKPDGSYKTTTYSGYKHMIHKSSYNIKTEEYDSKGNLIEKQQGSGKEYFNGTTEEKTANTSFLEQVRSAINNIFKSSDEEGAPKHNINIENVNIYTAVDNFAIYAAKKEAFEKEAAKIEEEKTKAEAEKAEEEAKKAEEEAAKKAEEEAAKKAEEEAAKAERENQYAEFLKWFRELFDKLMNKDEDE